MKNLRCIMLSFVICLNSLSIFYINTNDNVSKIKNKKSSIKKVVKDTLNVVKKITGSSSLALSGCFAVIAYDMHKEYNVAKPEDGIFEDIRKFKYVAEVGSLGLLSTSTLLLGFKLLSP